MWVKVLKTQSKGRNAALSLPGWQNIGEVGGKQFTGKIFGTPTSTVGFISAFGSGQATVASWLITPAINLTGAVNPVLTFKTSDAFDKENRHRRRFFFCHHVRF